MELNRFQKYLLSPYFNNDVRLLKLYDFYIKNKKAKKEASEISELHVWDANFSSVFDDIYTKKQLLTRRVSIVSNKAKQN